MSSLPLRGARTGNTYLRYHLACRNNRPLTPAPTRRLPVNAGNASADTEGSRPVLPALCGPFAAPLFAPLSAPGTLCGCALQLYFRFIGFMQYRLTPLNHKCVPLSSTIFHPWRAVPELTIENVKLKIVVFPSGMNLNCRQSRHHNFQLSIFDCPTNCS